MRTLVIDKLGGMIMVITNLGTFFLIRFRLYVASTMELFSKNSQRILAVNYFRKKASS